MSQVYTDFRRARIRKGFTLTSLAERCTELDAPVSDSHMSRIERGEFVPRPPLRKVLADLLDIDIDEFEKEAS